MVPHAPASYSVISRRRWSMEADALLHETERPNREIRSKNTRSCIHHVWPDLAVRRPYGSVGWKISTVNSMANPHAWVHSKRKLTIFRRKQNVNGNLSGFQCCANYMSKLCIQFPGYYIWVSRAKSFMYFFLITTKLIMRRKKLIVRTQASMYEKDQDI